MTTKGKSKSQARRWQKAKCISLAESVASDLLFMHGEYPCVTIVKPKERKRIMMYNEFLERTHWNCGEDIYHRFIEHEYNCSSLDKDTWCANWLRESGKVKVLTEISRTFQDYENMKKEHRKVLNINEQINVHTADQQKKIEKLKNDWRTLHQKICEFLVSKNDVNLLTDWMMYK